MEKDNTDYFAVQRQKFLKRLASMDLFIYRDSNGEMQAFKKFYFIDESGKIKFSKTATLEIKGIMRRLVKDYLELPDKD